MPVPVTAPAPSRRLLVVDNRDSYTFNLVQILSARAHEAHPGLEVVVVGADEPRSEERRVGKECRSRWSPYH